MKKQFLILLLLAGTFSTSKANKAADTAAHNLTTYQINSLQVLGKVWGFLKYYHPNVAKGQLNWDSVLIAKLPAFLSAAKARDLDNIILTWLNELGKVDSCTQCDNTLTGRLSYNLDTAWITHSGFNTSLVRKLQYILVNRYQGEHFYVKYGYAHQVNIINEPVYSGREFQFPSPAYRLLTLFRYWNIVNYFSPYKYITSKKWETVLTDLIPPFYQASDTVQYQLCIIKMIRALEDGHNGFNGPIQVSKFIGEYWYVPFICSIIDDKAVVTEILNDSLCKLQGIALHDVIISIDGETIEARIKKNIPYVYNATNREKELLSVSYNYLFAGNTNTCTITRLSLQGSTSQLVINRYVKAPGYAPPKRKTWEMLDNNIGYINMDLLLPKEVNTVMDTLNNTKGIIIDLRTYPRSTWHLIAARLCSHKFLSYRLAYPDLSFPGLYKYHPDQLLGQENNTPYRGKVVLLVNETTISHAEFSAMGLQAATKTITIGSTTAGADGDPTNWFSLPGGVTTRFSGLGVYYPDGTVAQKKGVKIDIVCKPTIKGLQQGKDELIEKAIKVINEK